MQDINSLLLNSSAVADLRGHPEYHTALNALIDGAGLAGLRPLADTFGAIVDSSVPTALNGIGDLAKNTPMQQFLDGSEVAAQNLKAAPQPAFLLAWLCVAGWSAKLDSRLYEQPDGSPHIGWGTLPCNCAEAALRIGAIDGARAMADQGYDVLMSAKYFTSPDIWARVEAYRRLAARIWRKYEIALANLVDDLRDACQVQPIHFRAETAALLWSLGMVPESGLLASTKADAWLPSRRLLLSVVRQSMQSMWFDPLVQYVWLELKDRGPFNIREHKVLFQRINACWKQSRLDEMLPVPPSQSYARALIAWFRGDLSEAQAREFMDGYELHASMYPRVNLADFVRLAAFAGMVVGKFGWNTGGSADEGMSPHWRKVAQTAGGMVRSHVMHPDSPEVYERVGGSFFHLIQECFPVTPVGAASGTPADPDAVVRALETYRSGALSYWLEVVPPLPLPAEQTALSPLRDQETEMLRYVRGSYFRMLSPILPAHFRRYSGDMMQMLEDQKEGWHLNDADAGRAQLGRVSDALFARYGELEAGAPRYVAKRRDPTAGLPELLSAINGHAVDSTLVTA